jgi:GNAT superfamily N-acetyltransferase
MPQVCHTNATTPTTPHWAIIDAHDAAVDPPEVAAMTATIRPARPGDEADILRLIQALADYEREPDAVETTVEDLSAHLFADVPRVFAHVAELDGRVVGIAVWFLNYSTWTGRHGIYLEDLFVDPAVRRQGVADGLMRALAVEAEARGFARMDWAVLDWNEPAKGFYRRLGAHHNETWEPWRLEGEALAALAKLSPGRSAPRS